MQNKLSKELSNLHANPIPGVEIETDPKKRLIWRVIIKGPQGSLYQGGKFILIIEFPENYPFREPYLRLETKIFHPNIVENGDLHGSVLKAASKEHWQPTKIIKPIIEEFLILFLYVYLEYPANQRAMKLYLTDQMQYDEEVRNYVKKYAI